MNRINIFIALTLVSLLVISAKDESEEQAWVRINQLGYKPLGSKVAVWCSKKDIRLNTFQLVDADNHKIIFTGKTRKAFGSYGPLPRPTGLIFLRSKKG
jgi:hypothetical protein